MNRLGSCALALCFALAACESPTQISVDVETNIPCAQVTVTAFTSGELGAIESLPPTTDSTSCSGGHLGTVVLVPSGQDNAEVGFKVVTALNDETVDKCSTSAAANDPNCIVARRALRYIPHTPLQVVVDMQQSCEGVICDAQTTCVNGVCENATIPDPSECEGTGCNQTVLGPEADSGVDASFVDATVGDATVADGTVSDATAVDAASETSTADAVADSPAPVEAGRFLDAAPCDMGGLQPGSPWPMAGNCPNGRARSPLVGPASPVFKWSLVLQSGFAFGGATIGADGTVYVGTSGTTETGIDGGVIEALSPDGGVQWVYSPAGGAIFDQTPAIAADSTLRFWDYNAGTYNVLALDGSVLQSSPSIPCRGGVTIVSGGTIYTPDDEADLCAFNEAGVERWSVPGPSGDYAHPSVAADGTIFSDNGSSLLAGIFPDGGQRWSVSLDAGSGLSPIVVAPDGTLRVIGGDGYLYSLDPTTGGVLWRTYVDVAGTLGGMAISDDGNTYIGTRTQLVAIDLAGHPAGSIVVNGGTFLPIVDANGDVYTACDAGNQLCSYNHALTAQRWSVTLPGFPGVSVDTPIIGPGGMIYTLAGQTYFTGVLYALGPP